MGAALPLVLRVALCELRHKGSRAHSAGCELRAPKKEILCSLPQELGPRATCQLQALPWGQPVPNSSPRFQILPLLERAKRNFPFQLTQQWQDPGLGAQNALNWVRAASPRVPHLNSDGVFGAGLARSRWLMAGP